MQVRRILSLAALGAAALAIQSVGAFAANNTASTTATVTAIVETPITINETSNMSFGDFTSDAAACTLTLSPAGTLSVTTGSCALIPSGGAISAATFAVGGTANRAFTTTVTTPVTLTSGANSLTLTPSNNAPASLGAGGTATINVGGALAIAANQPSGTYTGTVSVTVNY